MKEESPAHQQNQHSFFSNRASQHPSHFYSIYEVYSIRKQSISVSNDQIYKRLSKQFQKIKKIRAQPNSSSLIGSQYDYQNYQSRNDFRKLRQAYNNSSKASLITKKRIEKMRNQVDRIKLQIQKDELNAIKEVELTKLMGKATTNNSSASKIKST